MKRNRWKLAAAAAILIGLTGCAGSGTDSGATGKPAFGIDPAGSSATLGLLHTGEDPDGKEAREVDESPAGADPQMTESTASGESTHAAGSAAGMTYGRAFIDGLLVSAQEADDGVKIVVENHSQEIAGTWQPNTLILETADDGAGDRESVGVFMVPSGKKGEARIPHFGSDAGNVRSVMVQNLMMEEQIDIVPLEEWRWCFPLRTDIGDPSSDLQVSEQPAVVQGYCSQEGIQVRVRQDLNQFLTVSLYNSSASRGAMIGSDGKASAVLRTDAGVYRAETVLPGKNAILLNVLSGLVISFDFGKFEGTPISLTLTDLVINEDLAEYTEKGDIAYVEDLGAEIWADEPEEAQVVLTLKTSSAAREDSADPEAELTALWSSLGTRLTDPAAYEDMNPGEQLCCLFNRYLEGDQAFVKEHCILPPGGDEELEGLYIPWKKDKDGNPRYTCIDQYIADEKEGTSLRIALVRMTTEADEFCMLAVLPFLYRDGKIVSFKLDDEQEQADLFLEEARKLLGAPEQEAETEQEAAAGDGADPDGNGVPDGNTAPAAEFSQGGSYTAGGSTGSARTPCPICGGSGVQYVSYYDTIMGWQNMPQVCSGCAGSGFIG